MAHILFYQQGNMLAYAKKIRYMLDGKDCFRENTPADIQTEEALADHLGFYIASKMDYEDTGGAMEEYFQEEKVARRRAWIMQLERT